jgi:hypothetical protein
MRFPEDVLMRLTRVLLVPLIGMVPASLRAQPAASNDTIRLEVGSPRLDGRVYRPHAARVRVRVGDPAAPVSSEWTNELTLGDSAGHEVMRWVTKGNRTLPDGTPVTWELLQTYDARTLKPLGYLSRYSHGQFAQVRIDGNRVTGQRRSAADTTMRPIDVTLDRPGYFAGASDLVPAAVGFKAGTVVIAPVWNPNMTKAEGRIFTILGTARVNVEGTMVEAWKVEERREADRVLLATWYLLDKSPYMVYGEAVLPDGRIQYMSEVEIPRTMR